MIETRAKAQELRNRLIDAVSYPSSQDTVYTGSSFFINLTSICPVACVHCMYSSNLTPKTVRDSFDKEELSEVIKFFNESQSEKLSISGGGEPFLKFNSIVRIVSQVKTPMIELLTSGNWAKTQARAASVFRTLSEAANQNPYAPKVSIRLSIDRYHIEAPRGVPLQNYANAARAWAEADRRIGLGYRSLNEDWNDVDVGLAQMLSASLVDINDWNRRIVLPDGTAIPFTYNVLRLSGAAAELKQRITPQKRAQDHYKTFEGKDGRLSLATMVNDSVNGKYIESSGLSITLDSDGQYWIFCGTAPDRKLRFGTLGFQESVRYFMRDPISQFLIEEGVWRLADLVRDVDPNLCDDVLAMNDTTFMVDELLKDADTRLKVTLSVLKEQQKRGTVRIIEPDALQAAKAALEGELA